MAYSWTNPANFKMPITYQGLTPKNQSYIIPKYTTSFKRDIQDKIDAQEQRRANRKDADRFERQVNKKYAGELREAKRALERADRLKTESMYSEKLPQLLESSNELAERFRQMKHNIPATVATIKIAGTNAISADDATPAMSAYKMNFTTQIKEMAKGQRWSSKILTQDAKILNAGTITIKDKHHGKAFALGTQTSFAKDEIICSVGGSLLQPGRCVINKNIVELQDGDTIEKIANAIGQELTNINGALTVKCDNLPTIIDVDGVFSNFSSKKYEDISAAMVTDMTKSVTLTVPEGGWTMSEFSSSFNDAAAQQNMFVQTSIDTLEVETNAGTSNFGATKLNIFSTSTGAKAAFEMYDGNNNLLDFNTNTSPFIDGLFDAQNYVTSVAQNGLITVNDIDMAVASNNIYVKNGAITNVSEAAQNYNPANLDIARTSVAIHSEGLDNLATREEIKLLAKSITGHVENVEISNSDTIVLDIVSEIFEKARELQEFYESYNALISAFPWMRSSSDSSLKYELTYGQFPILRSKFLHFAQSISKLESEAIDIQYYKDGETQTLNKAVYIPKLPNDKLTQEMLNWVRIGL